MWLWVMTMPFNKLLLLLLMWRLMLWKDLGKILVYAQCPSCPLPFCPSEMPFPLDDLSFNALYQNTILEMPFWNCPFFKMPFLVDLSFNALHQNALSEMPFQKCPFNNALHQDVLFQIVLCYALSQFALYQIDIECNFFIIQVISDFEISNP